MIDPVVRRLAEIPNVSNVVGEFVQMMGSLARVNVQGATVDIRCDGWTPPIPGQPVRVDILNGQMRVTGPSSARSALGVVVEALDSNTRARVTVDGTVWTLPVMAPYVPIPTDQVVIDWQSGFILGEQANVPQDTTPGTIPGAPKPFTDLLVLAQGSGKYQVSWWGNGDVRASNNNVGAWFYHGAFSVLAGADISRVEVYFPPPWRAVGALFIGLHPHPTRPAGNPGIGSLVSSAQRAGWVTLPAGWGTVLRDNPGWGIGVTSGAGDNQWPGVPQDGMSGALRFAGSR